MTKAPPDPTSDDRDRVGIRRRWSKVEEYLVWYTQSFSAARIFGFRNREGAYLLLAFGVLLTATFLVSREVMHALTWVRWMVGGLAACYVLDSLAVNTSITFITRRPIHNLRSIALTLFNVLNVTLAFSALYAIERWCFRDPPIEFVDAIYFSLLTLTTVGHGDPGGECPTSAKLTVVTHVIVSLYFLAVVLTTVVSWASRPNDSVPSAPSRQPEGNDRLATPRKRPLRASACIALISALATVAIAILTYVYVDYSGKQWVAMQDALHHSREALKVTERAYVNLGFANGKFMELLPLQVGQPIRVAIHLNNSGRLPATRVVTNYGIGLPKPDGSRENRQWPFHHVTTCDPRRDDLSKHPDWIETIIPANGLEIRYLTSPDPKLSKSDIDAINAGGEISVMGFIEYCDGFDHVQCLSFCASYKADARKDFVPCLRGVLNYCPAGFGPPGPL
jgi:hypothetical protein